MKNLCSTLTLGFLWFAVTDHVSGLPPHPPSILPLPIFPPVPPPPPLKLLSLKNPQDLIPKDVFMNDMNPLVMAAGLDIAAQILSKPNLKEVLQAIKDLRQDETKNKKLAYWAISIARLARPDLITSTGDDQNSNLPFQAFPDLFFPSDVLQKAYESENETQCVKTDESVGSDNGVENALWYFREDLFLNSHHWFWHRAHPTMELYDIIKEKNPQFKSDIIGKAADRKGELWYYMHQGFLARYKTERMLNKLPPFQVLNFKEKVVLKEGYNAHMAESNSGKKWVDRPANKGLQNVTFLSNPRNSAENLCDVIPDTCITTERLKMFVENLDKAVTSGSFKSENGSVISLKFENGTSILTDLMEASSASKNPTDFGLLGIHGNGHFAVANIMNPTPNPTTQVGVMGDTATAIRDPVFYRLHGLADNYFVAQKKLLPPYKLDEGDHQLRWKGVKVNNIRAQITGAPENHLKTFWNFAEFDLSIAGLSLNPSQTLPNKKRKVCAKHLDHEPFQYNIDITNTLPSAVNATVRIFLAPRFDEKEQRLALEEQRRLFFPLDRFGTTLTSGTNDVVRSSVDSATTIPWTKQLKGLNDKRVLNPSQEAAKSSSGDFCGWPNHLLLPLGSKDGSEFDLVVLVTEDKMNRGVTNSASSADVFCGIPGQKYPDEKPMGFPFDRPFDSKAKDVEGLTALVDNMAVSKVSIHHKD